MRGQFLQRMVGPQTIGAEIGVHKGEFTQAILEYAKPKQLHLIDPWYLYGKEWKWTLDNKSTVDALIGILKRFENELVSRTIILHIGYDWDILKTFSNFHFDWVYLDSSHKYEHTLKELELLQSKVKPEGVITGDDWHTDISNLHHGVCKAVQEFVAKNPYEIVYQSDEDHQWAIRKILT